MNELLSQINALIQAAQLDDKNRQSLLARIVEDNWGELPPWSTLRKPEIKVVEMATAGAGVAITFNDDGIQKVILAEAGEHYGKGAGAFMISGGFINLTKTVGSKLVYKSNMPETARIGGARETEEELTDLQGNPLFAINPDRLKLMDTDTLVFRSGERRIVIGMMLELVADEITRVKKHVAKMAADPDYKAAVAEHTINKDTGKPEVASLAIANLTDAAAGHYNLLHPDQIGLFRQMTKHFGLL